MLVNGGKPSKSVLYNRGYQDTAIVTSTNKEHAQTQERDQLRVPSPAGGNNHTEE